MSLMLGIFTELAHEDVLLPKINNADFSAKLDKRLFGIKKDLVLELEILDNAWRFKESTYFTLFKDNEKWWGKPIVGGDILSLTYEERHFTIMVADQSDRIASYDKFDTLRLGKIVIGKESDCDLCYSAGEVMSRHHASIHFGRGSAQLDDLSTNGVYVNGRRIQRSVQLQFGDVISIFGLELVYLMDTVAVNVESSGVTLNEHMERQKIQPIPELMHQRTAVEQESPEPLFHRSPRKMYSLFCEPEEIEGPPQKQNTNRKPVWMIIGPSFTMAIPMLLGTGFMAIARQMSGTASNIFMYMGLVTSIASAIIGVTWALINLNYSKKEEKVSELMRMQKYGEYLMECAERIRGKYEHNRKAMLDMYPDSKTCCTYYRNTQELWSRNRSHEDFMCYRLGLGDVPFQVGISVPPKKFTLIQDDLSDRPREIKETYATLMQVPITLDLYAHRVVGIIGQNRGDLARSLIMQIAANNCYTDVRLAILSDGSTGADWSFMKWLPHVWNESRSLRYVALEKDEISGVSYELAQKFRTRLEEAESTSASRKGVRPTQYVVVVESCELLESEGLAKYLFDNPELIGVTTLLLDDRYEDLPNSCEYIVESGQSFSGVYSMVPDGEKPVKVNFDYVSVAAAEHFARRISGIRVVETGSGSGLIDSLSFMDMLGVQRLQDLTVLDNWKKNRTYQTMQAMVGWKAGGAPCYLNIHEKHHGPHGLIAGTTGSGKSETLQTYILSLAINYSPQDIGFFIIDFKGGGMANLFDGLPHMLGTISNLSGNQVRRAMVSIKSENLRRQRIFNEYGVNHIDGYTKLVKNGEASVPIPHMFIIIDEFAELKREQPEFMRELISVAQVGRSLGVHLILATQKPSGTVDDNIWSNTKFRLCLRVADKQDSKDMLHKPDAAYLTQAGRCYLQVGNDEIYELFQSGWSGATYEEDAGSNKTNYAVQLENGGKVVMTGSSTKSKRLAAKRIAWISLLIRCMNAATDAQGQLIMDELFRVFASKNVDYADSVYNRRQLVDFWESFRNLFDQEPEKAAEQILQVVHRTGKRLPELKDKTQLDAIVEYLGEVARKGNFELNLKLWMPVLPRKLLLSDIKGKVEPPIADWSCPPVKTTLRTTVGMVDDPQNQNQFPLEIDFLENGHLAICGAVSSGKSVLMQTIAYSLARTHTPDMLNIYAVDYSSQMLAPFEELPHTGGIVFEGETDKLKKLFLLMGRMLKERKALFRGGSFQQYISANGNVVPAILLMIDGYASFREKTENAYEAQLLELARDGAGFGIFLCMSSGGFGTGEIQAKIGDKIRQVLCLEMDSKYSYGDCLRTMAFDVLPESGVQGRGLAPCGDTILEYQVGLAADGDDYARSNAIAEYSRSIAKLWKGKVAAPIPQIPQNPDWETFSQTEDYRQMVSSERYLPVAYRKEDASVYSIDLCKTFCYHVSGRERSGKSIFLRNVACSALARGARVILVDRIGQTTETRTAAIPGVEYINTVDGLFQMWKDIILTINERVVRKKELVQKGMEDEEIYAGMLDYRQVFVLISDLPDFMQHCNNPGPGKASMGPGAENIITKGAQNQIFFFGAVNNQEIAAASTQNIYRAFVKGKQGVHLAGELNSQKLLSYRNIPFAEQGRSQKPGMGYVVNEEDNMCVDEIVIPMNKGVADGKGTR